MVSRPDTPTSGISTSSSSKRSASKQRERGADGDSGRKDEDRQPIKTEPAPCLSAGGDYSTCMMPSNVNIPPGTKVTKGDLELFR